MNVSFDIGLTLVTSRHLVSLVLAEHLLEVLFLLSTLFLLKGSLHFHLVLKSVYEVNLLSESILVFSALSGLLFAELAVTALFLLCDLLTLSFKLF